MLEQCGFACVFLRNEESRLFTKFWRRLYTWVEIKGDVPVRRIHRHLPSVETAASLIPLLNCFRAA